MSFARTYGNLLGRAANAEEIGFWRERIAQFGRGSVLADICRLVRC